MSEHDNAHQNPRYIRVMAALTGANAGRYKIMQLAYGNERATMPIYHIPRRDRATGSYTSDEAVAAIQALMERDAQSGAIRRGQAAQAGYSAVDEAIEIIDRQDKIGHVRKLGLPSAER